MDTENIKPVGPVDTVVSVPGSKSLTQRALVIAALAEGKSVLWHGLVSEDTLYLMDGLRALGAEIVLSGDLMEVTGTGGRIGNPGRAIFLGNNGTALRFFTTLVSLGKGAFILDGENRLRERPVGPLLEALKVLGVRAATQDGKGYPPIVIEADGLPGGNVTLTDIESSQFVSSLLISAPYAREDMEVQLRGRIVSEPYVDMTLNIMESFGVKAFRDEGKRFRVKCGQRYAGKPFLVEGDASSASYFFLAAALCRGRIRVENMTSDSLQGDIGLLKIIESAGCAVNRGDSWIEVIGGQLRTGEWALDMGGMPDMVPTVAVLSAFRPGHTVITNVAHLRIKESDRIAAMVNELNRMGVTAKETEDGLTVDGGTPHGAEIETYNDHRIAMSFAVAGLVVPGVQIKNRNCVNKSFPGFWDELKKL